MRNKNKTKKLFHLSFEYKKDTWFYPRIPQNTMENEDKKTKRICVSLDTFGCIMASLDKIRDYMERNQKPIKLFIHQFVLFEKDFFVPSKILLPDVELTNERWIFKKIKSKVVGEITVKSVCKNARNLENLIYEEKWLTQQ